MSRGRPGWPLPRTRRAETWRLPPSQVTVWRSLFLHRYGSRYILVVSGSASLPPRPCVRPLHRPPCMDRSLVWRGLDQGLQHRRRLALRATMSCSGREAWRSSHRCSGYLYRGLERPVPSQSGLWNRFTFRYGEARHPGPPQRIVSVNPRGWSRLAPLLQTMKEEVILVQETFLHVGNVAK
eukprot:3698758-Amphidinium_carterae.1